MLDGAGRGHEALLAYDALFDSRTLGGSYLADPVVVGRYAALCERQGRAEDAAALYRRLVSAFRPTPGVTPPQPSNDVRGLDLPALKATAKLIEGIGYAGRMQDEAALARYEEAVRLKPDFALAYVHLAFRRERLRDAKGAEAAYRKAYALGGPEVRAAVLHFRPEMAPKGSGEG